MQQIYRQQSFTCLFYMLTATGIQPLEVLEKYGLHIWHMKTSGVLKITTFLVRLMISYGEKILKIHLFLHAGVFSHFPAVVSVWLNNFLRSFPAELGLAGKLQILERLLFLCKHRRLACGLDYWWSWTSLFLYQQQALGAKAVSKQPHRWYMR